MKKTHDGFLLFNTACGPAIVKINEIVMISEIGGRDSHPHWTRIYLKGNGSGINIPYLFEVVCREVGWTHEA